MMNRTKFWLDSKVNDKTISNKYEVSDFSLTHYASNYPKEAYYVDGDQDFDANDKFYYNLLINTNEGDVEEGLRQLYQYLDHLFIPPNTNRYHANHLFRKMKDFSLENGFDYKVYEPTIKKYGLYNFIDAYLKEDFYKFCYQYSDKNI